MSGTVGLDLDQDGRSFAVLDIDRDGDEDLLVMAARQAPHLRVFQNDFAPKAASLAVRLVGSVGSKSNRDAIGARVVVETDRMRRTKIVQAGSGFLSQRSKELVFGLGESQRVVKLTIAWPSGGNQIITDVPLNTRVRIEEGARPSTPRLRWSRRHGRPVRNRRRRFPQGEARRGSSNLSGTGLFSSGSERTAALARLRSVGGPPSSCSGRPNRLARAAPSRHLRVGARRWPRLVSRRSLSRSTRRPTWRRSRPAATDPSLPVVGATPEMGLSYAIVNRHLFMNRQDMRLPTTLLLDQAERIVKVHREAPGCR